ncbi:porin [Piscinibacter sp.]|uniref:porin n=1 Tax=Piscinibacter sp. TaxID=1903157 RepID=UPI003559CD6D
MKTRFTPIALAFAAMFATSVHAQSAADLQQAADRAVKAAEQAMKAAADAQRAAEQAQQAVTQAQAAAADTNARAKPAAAPAQATGLSYQSGGNSVSLYGLLDVTLTHVDHANAAGDARTSYQPAPWFSGSRWGLTGKHDLGTNGLAAIFRLESEFITNTGEEDSAGILFGRDAWLGLESADLGKLSFGRQNALGRDIAAGYLDPYGAAKASTAEGGGTNTNNFKQLIFYAGSATGTRYDRGVVWKKVFDNGIVGGLGYQFGGVAGSFSTNSTKTAALAFNGGPFNIAGFVDSADVAHLKHNSYSIGGNYSFGLVRVNAGYFHYTADQGAAGAAGKRTDNAYTLSASFKPDGKLDYQAGYQVMSAKNAGITGSGATANVLNAYADTTAITTTATGKRKTLYGSIFYHFDRQTEVYLAADHLSLTDAYRQKGANGFLSQNELGVGMRFRF